MLTSQAVTQNIMLNSLISSKISSQKLVMSKGDILQMVLKCALQINLSFRGLTSLVEIDSLVAW